MARAACKIIIDSFFQGLVSGLERVLMSPLVHDVMLPADECQAMIQRLADLEISTYMGSPRTTATDLPLRKADSLTAILLDLQAAGIFTDEIWEVLRHPGNPPVPSGA